MTNSLIEPLLQPLFIGKLTLPNRIVMSPMTRNFSPEGVPGDDVAAYYRRRAEGGVGTIITEAVCVEHKGAVGDAGLGEHGTPYMWTDAALDGWRKVVSEVHAAGGKIFPQLWHMGVMKRAGTGPFPDFPACRPNGIWGPTDRKTVLSDEYRVQMKAPTAPMTESDIADVIEAFAKGASNAKAVGFDGIALHGGHGYLLDTFLWGETNTRSEKWGGDHVGRTRFVVELIKSVKAAVGPDMPISMRYSQWKSQDYDAVLVDTPQQLEEMLTPISEAGIDIFDPSTRNFDVPAFEGSDMGLSGWTKKITGKPTMMVGGVCVHRDKYASALTPPQTINNIDRVLARFDAGEFDLLAVGRSLVNDPNWLSKVKAGEELLPFSPRSMRELT